MTDDQLQFIPRVQRPSDATTSYIGLSPIGYIGEIRIQVNWEKSLRCVNYSDCFASIDIRTVSSGGETQKVQVENFIFIFVTFENPA